MTLPLDNRWLILVLFLGAACPTTPQCGPGACFGCCTAAGECVAGQSASACGSSGQQCSTCSGLETCQAGYCIAPLSNGGGGGSVGGGSGGGGGSGSCQTCLSLGKNCGSVSDGCGHTLECGTCQSPLKCGWGSPAVPNVCGAGTCTLETDRIFCERVGKNCGPVVDWDNCDNSRSVASCGVCTSPQECGAGVAGVCGRPRAWSVVPFNGQVLSRVWGSAKNDVWAVGAAGTVLHFNGTAWAVHSSPTTAALLSIDGSGPNEVWVAGEGVLYRWNGSAWSSNAATAASATYYDVALLGGEPWYVASVDGAGGVIGRKNMAQWWSTSQGIYRAILPTAVNDVRVFGFSDIARWNGTEWNLEAHFGNSNLFDVWARTPTDVWTVGDGVYRWQGTQWVKAASPSGVTLWSVWGSGANDVWVVGERGHIFHYTDTQWEHVASPLPVGEGSQLYGVWGSSADDVWAVGALNGLGVILHYPD